MIWMWKVRRRRVEPSHRFRIIREYRFLSTPGNLSISSHPSILSVEYRRNPHSLLHNKIYPETTIAPKMCDCLCYVVPPHLLRSISDSQHNTQAVRAAARDSLARQTKVNTCRHDRMKAIVKGKNKSKGRNNVLWGRIQKPSLPGQPNVASVDLLRHIANSETADERVRERARENLEKGLDAEDKTQAKRRGSSIPSMIHNQLLCSKRAD